MVDHEQEGPAEEENYRGGVDLGFRECMNCHESFPVRRPWQVFCGNACRMRYHLRERREAIAEYKRMKTDRGITGGK